MEIGIKLRLIREMAGLSREAFAEMTGVPAATVKRYETGRIANIGSETLLKITQNKLFYKYTLWLMTDQTAPESGQISPNILSKLQDG
ncbi:helix-turn-helix domain-containing protein [Enterobacter hormaechei]